MEGGRPLDYPPPLSGHPLGDVQRITLDILIQRLWVIYLQIIPDR